MDWYRLFHPKFWMQNEPTSKVWSDALKKKLLDPNVRITRDSKHTVKIDDVLIWASNYPYSYGHVYGISDVVLPKARIRKMLHDRLAAPEEWK